MFIKWLAVGATLPASDTGGGATASKPTVDEGGEGVSGVKGTPA